MTMMPRVLHLIADLVIGGAQRTVATLRKTPNLISHATTFADCDSEALNWADVVVAHAWRSERDSPRLNVPTWLRRFKQRPVIIFNHDWEGLYEENAALVIVYSSFAATNWVGPQQAHILPGGINIGRFAQPRRARTWSGPVVVGRLSTLHHGKINVDTLADWPRLNASIFLIGGGGSELPSLRSAFQDPRFRFLGTVEPSRTHEFLAQLDVFLYDTVWHIESFCYVILEAMASGCVVVASRRGSIGELVKDGETGFLFDEPQMAVPLCNRVLKDVDLCRATSARAALAAQAFSSERMMARFANCVRLAIQK